MSYKTALITGASTGIGKEFALALARERKWNLILVARNKNSLQQVQNDIYALWSTHGISKKSLHGEPTITLESVDLISEVNRTAMMTRIKSSGVSVDFLINNAGMGFGISALTPFSQSDSTLNEQMINLNCIAPIHLCRLVLPDMLAKKSGKIINICSRRAFTPMPYLACYAATKTFLLYHSIALAREVEEQGIRVLAFCPSPANTPGHQNHAINMKSLLKPTSPKKVAECALKIIDTNASVYVMGFINKVVFGIFRLMPLQLATKIQSYITTSTYPSIKHH